MQIPIFFTVLVKMLDSGSIKKVRQIGLAVVLSEADEFLVLTL